jgi:hypothetical protein
MDTFLLDTSNLFFFFSGFLMFYTAYRDRQALRGYNLLGTIIIVLAITLGLAFYTQQGFWLSFALTLPMYIYWIIVCTSILRGRIWKNTSTPTSGA